MNAQSDTVIIALAIITLIGTLATTIIGAVVAIMTSRQNAKIEQTKASADKTQEAVNGFTHELVDAKAASAKAEGRLEGEARERERQLLAATPPPNGHIPNGNGEPPA